MLVNNLPDGAPPVADIQPRSWDYDAFFVDEFHAKKERDPDTSAIINRFSGPLPSDKIARATWRKTSTTIGPTTKRMQFKNPLQDPKLATPVETVSGNPDANADWWYWVYVKARFKQRGELLANVVKTKLKPRGSYASSPAASESTGKIWVGSWLPTADANALADLAMKEMVIPPKTPGQSPSGFLNDPKLRLLGWVGAAGVLDVSHDTHVPEFAWEHLLGDW